VIPAPSQPVRTVTVDAADASYLVKIWVTVTDTDCAAHAYGQVVAYLQQHPCTGMTRLLATTVVNGRPVGFAQTTIGFSGDYPQIYQTAGDFRQLVTADGTGNINDLLREGRRLPTGPTSVPQPNAFAALSQDSAVTIDELWYLDGPTPENDPPLVQLAQDMYLQF
jgi:hypothetical protein